MNNEHPEVTGYEALYRSMMNKANNTVVMLFTYLV